MYDFWDDYGTVDENVFAYSNRYHHERAVILYNNSYHSTHGTIHSSVGFLDKRSGELTQRSLGFGLNLPDDESMVMAFRDHVVGLEYLRRARDLREHGLSVGLRGYQHMALLHWRELRPTASHPWDRLCDALNGSGVYSVEEALSKLQIQPLLDALRQAVSPEMIRIFESLARESSLEDLPASAADEEISMLADEPGDDDAAPEAVREAEEASVAAPGLPALPALDPRLEDFVAKAYLFADRVSEFFATDGRSADFDSVARTDGAPMEPDDFRSLVAASARLPEALSAFPKSLERAAAIALPAVLPAGSLPAAWAAALGWLVFQTIDARYSAIAVFERLNLRWALAETFSSVGLEGEAAWKAAAQVRVLLKYCEPGSDCLWTPEFWADPDVRWLAGVNTSEGVEYVKRERFEELVCWCQLPALPASATAAAEDGEDLVALLVESGYELAAFVELLWQDEQAPAAKDAESSTTSSALGG